MPEIEEVPLNKVKPNPWNIRSKVDEKKLIELSNSVKSKGVVQPIKVRRRGRWYEIVYGYRRWLAAKMAFLETIPCIIVDIDDREVRTQSILENLHQEELPPIDLANALKELTNLGCSTYDIARMTGKSEPWVVQKLGLLKCKPEVQQMVEGVQRSIIGELEPQETIIYTKLGLTPQEGAAIYAQDRTFRKLKPTTAIIIQQKVKDSEKQVELAKNVVKFGLTQQETIETIKNLEKLERGQHVQGADIDGVIQPDTPFEEAVKKVVRAVRNYRKIKVMGALYDKLLRTHRDIAQTISNPPSFEEFALMCLEEGLNRIDDWKFNLMVRFEEET